MNILLQDIAEVRSWIFARTWKWGEILYLQAKYFNDYWELIKELPDPDLNSEDIQKKHILQPWDILFCAKWTRNFAVVYNESFWPCVASSTFIVVRLKSWSDFLSQYIALILNNIESIKYIKKRNLTGTTVGSISKKTIENFYLKKIAIEKQQKLIEINDIYRKQLSILREIAEKKEKLISNIILQFNTSKHV